MLPRVYKYDVGTIYLHCMHGTILGGRHASRLVATLYQGSKGVVGFLNPSYLVWDGKRGVEWYPKCWSSQACSRLGILQGDKCTRYMRERQVQESLVTLSCLVWIGMGCVEWYPKCWSPQACSRLGILQGHKCTRYMRERHVQESLVTLSCLVWVGMGCVEWYPKCWSPQACSRLGILQGHKRTRYMRERDKSAKRISRPQVAWCGVDNSQAKVISRNCQSSKGIPRPFKL